MGGWVGGRLTEETVEDRPYVFCLREVLVYQVVHKGEKVGGWVGGWVKRLTEEAVEDRPYVFCVG